MVFFLIENPNPFIHYSMSIFDGCQTILQFSIWILCLFIFALMTKSVVESLERRLMNFRANLKWYRSSSWLHLTPAKWISYDSYDLRLRFFCCSKWTFHCKYAVLFRSYWDRCWSSRLNSIMTKMWTTQKLTWDRHYPEWTQWADSIRSLLLLVWMRAIIW